MTSAGCNCLSLAASVCWKRSEFAPIHNESDMAYSRYIHNIHIYIIHTYKPLASIQIVLQLINYKVTHKDLPTPPRPSDHRCHARAVPTDPAEEWSSRRAATHLRRPVQNSTKKTNHGDDCDKRGL